MQSSEFRDPYKFNSYYLRRYQENNGRPLIRKTSRLIFAVVNNHVESLRELLDSPKWYDVRDRDNFNLMAIAFHANRRKVFNYMVSLPDFVEKCGKETLEIVFNTHTGRKGEEYFTHQLIIKGVDVDVTFSIYRNILDASIGRGFVSVFKLLMERGMDIHELNNNGHTSLESAVFTQKYYFAEKYSEIVATLLAHGAEPYFSMFERLLFRNQFPQVQEMLFLYTVDSFLDCEIEFEFILKLALSESWMFDEILNYPIKISVNGWNNTSFTYFYFLCSMKVDYLRRIIERFGSLLSEIFRVTDSLTHSLPFKFTIVINDENLDLLFQSGLISVDFLVEMETFELFDHLIQNSDENRITELYCFFLSYGAVIDERDFQLVYKHFGFCQLFKILLRMDHQICDENVELIPRIMYDPTISLEKVLEKSKDNYCCIMESSHEVLHYFADRRLVVEPYLQGTCCVIKKEDLSTLPRLVELARNKFREDFIKKFDIKTSKKFLALLDCLPVKDVHKKILSYETKLYF